METTNACLAVLAFILAVGVQTGLSVSCYECNSRGLYDGEHCADLKKDAAVSANFLFDCNEKYGQNYTMCRKMHQAVGSESFVVRQCALDGRLDRCIEKTGTRGIKIKYCECKGEECNSATYLSAGVLSVVAVVIAALMSQRS